MDDEGARQLIGSQPQQPQCPTDNAPGFRFQPTDEEKIVYYLRRHTDGKTAGNVVVEDVYGTEPWNLLKEGKEEGIFFARRTRKSANSKRASRKAGGGSWRTFTGKKTIKFGETAVGSKTSLSFKYDQVKYSGYVMDEYELLDDGDRGENFQEHVLCHIKLTRGGKRRQREWESYFDFEAFEKNPPCTED